jgi:drug/metabolite transporter (DMT)-like permease
MFPSPFFWRVDVFKTKESTSFKGTTMSRAFATIIFGLAASLCWGSGDFSGGLASRRANASSVVIAAYAIGFVLLVALALLWKESFPSSLDIVWGALAGLAGAIGLISFYSALSIGRMGIAAPVSAVLTASLPVLFSAFTQGLPSVIQLGGFVLALLAIALISRPEGAKGRPEGIGLAVLAGCGFGCFFILISRVNATSTFWPLAVARFTSVLFLLLIVRIRKQQTLPPFKVAPLVLLAGVLDAIGNAFFVLAAHAGRLDVAAVLSSLYPAATVLLAALVLRERVNRIQAIGILLALVAVPLISA